MLDSFYANARRACRARFFFTHPCHLSLRSETFRTGAQPRLDAPPGCRCPGPDAVDTHLRAWTLTPRPWCHPSCLVLTAVHLRTSTLALLRTALHCLRLDGASTVGPPHGSPPPRHWLHCPDTGTNSVPNCPL
jgi:hypothetical protein